MAELESLQRRLQQTADSCLSLANFLGSSGHEQKVITLTNGAKRFSQGVNSLDEVTALLKIIDSSFTEEGPRLPTLLRELSALEPSSTILTGTNPIDGFFECDRGGKILDSFTEKASMWIKTSSHSPFLKQSIIPVIRSRFSCFNNDQQLITEAFFMHGGGTLILPTIADVFGFYLQRRCRGRILSYLFESYISESEIRFFEYAGQIIYKINNLGTFTAEDYKKARGLRKFEKIIMEIIAEYTEIRDDIVTPDILTKIALRETELKS